MRFVAFTLALMLSSGSAVMAQTGPAAPPAPPPPITVNPPVPLSGYDAAIPIDPSEHTAPGDLASLDARITTDENTMTGLRDAELLQERGRMWVMQPAMPLNQRGPFNCLPFQKKCRPGETLMVAAVTPRDKQEMRREYETPAGPPSPAHRRWGPFRCLPFDHSC